MESRLKRTLALALAGGTLAIGVPAALAAGGGGDGGSAASGTPGAPSGLIQDGQDRARPDGHDCPERDGGGERGDRPEGGGDRGAQPDASSGTGAPAI